MEANTLTRLPSVNWEVPAISFTSYWKNEVKKMNFSDFRGKWLVVFFYPADFTFICPTELEDMANTYADFQKEGCEVVSFSTDTHWTHKAWHDTSKAIAKINFPMGADPTGTVAKTFGTYIADGGDGGLSYRGSFIVDPDGKVKTCEIHDNSIGRSAKELLRKLKAAKFVREHNGEVCPANWTPGEKTLKPGLDLVGKI